MIRYLLNLRRPRRPNIDPLPIDFGGMYFLYPSESGYIEGFRLSGPGEKLFEMVKGFFRRSDETRNYRPEKIY